MNPRRILATVALMLFLSAPHFVYAQTQEGQTVESLLAQISQLTATIANLQAQIATLQSGPSVVAYTFSRNLSIGDKGEDVRILQKILNNDVRTRVAVSGDGSKGQETAYFGSLTAAAVTKFQELYASEVLAPVGLIQGTGYVGPSTRKKLSSLGQIATPAFSSGQNTQNNGQNTGVSGQTTTNNGSNSTISYGGTNSSNSTNNLGVSSLPSISLAGATGFFISTANSAEGAPGEILTINGNGFSSIGNTVRFDTQAVSGIPSITGSSLTFTIPGSIAKGAHVITVTNNTGETADGSIDFVVKNVGATSPVIYTVSPAVGDYGSQVTIYGSGFTDHTNRVLMGETVLQNVARVGNNKLIVTVAPTELSDLANSTPADDVAAEWPVYISVSNENGMTVNPVVFVIRK